MTLIMVCFEESSPNYNFTLGHQLGLLLGFCRSNCSAMCSTSVSLSAWELGKTGEPIDEDVKHTNAQKMYNQVMYPLISFQWQNCGKLNLGIGVVAGR